MKGFGIILVSLFLPFFVCGFSPPPAWNRIEGKTTSFFKDMGFDFSVDDSMAHHYEKKTVEICISIPARFIDAGLTNEFDSISILSEDISTDLGTHDHAGKRRAILTVSEEMTRKSQVLFYFRNEAKDVTRGSMYVLDLGAVLDDWKKSREKKPNQGAAPNAGGLRQFPMRTPLVARVGELNR